ncbi:MAG: HD domain-containing protein [Spirochaetales bacterium]|nr:HD domain-containing protein [Spirochaetales bacterium]
MQKTNEIAIKTLAPYTYFNAPVLLDDKYLLLTENIPVTENLIKRLHKWRFTNLYTAGQSSEQPFPGLGGGGVIAFTLNQNLKEQEGIKDVAQFYNEMLDFTEKRFTDFVTNNKLPIQLITETIKNVIEKVKNRRNYILRMADMQAGGKSYIVAHSVKVTFLCIAVGMHMRLPPHKLIELGISALLHEIGMVRLPPHLYLSDKVLSHEEKRAITAHTVLGFKILKQYDFPMPVCLAVLEHHEHPDGTGYPRGIKDEQISLPAKIIGACSSYTALVSRRPYRGGREGHSVLMELLQDRGKMYDDAVLKALVYCLSLYPVGSYVALQSGAKGIVAEPNIENPKAPMVKVLVSASGTRHKDPYLIKSEDAEKQIDRPLTREEILQIDPEAAAAAELEA